MKAVLIAVAAFLVATLLAVAIVGGLWLGEGFRLGKGSPDWALALPWISLPFIALLLSTPAVGVAAAVFAYRWARAPGPSAPTGPDPTVAAVIAAIEGYRHARSAAVFCPICRSQIKVNPFKSEDSRQVLKLNCKCGRSCGVFDA